MWKSYPLHKACGGGKTEAIFPENRCFYAGKRPDISGKTPEHLPSNASAFQIKRRSVRFQKQKLLFFTLETSLSASFQKQQKGAESRTDQTFRYRKDNLQKIKSRKPLFQKKHAFIQTVLRAIFSTSFECRCKQRSLRPQDWQNVNSSSKNETLLPFS